jgi:regulator of replication initiation timing
MDNENWKQMYLDEHDSRMDLVDEVNEMALKHRQELQELRRAFEWDRAENVRLAKENSRLRAMIDVAEDMASQYVEEVEAWDRERHTPDLVTAFRSAMKADVKQRLEEAEEVVRTMFDGK